MGSRELFAQAEILPISAFQIAGIIDMSHWHLAKWYYLNKKLLGHGGTGL
jgi:hypothetical protein